MIDFTPFNSSNASVSRLISGNKIPWTVVFSIQFFFAMIGNPLIVWIVYKDKRLRTTTNYLVANMAVSDFLGALFEIPITIFRVNHEFQWIIGGVLGNSMCKLCEFTINVSLPVSLYSCVFIAIVRYYAVVHPMKKDFQSKSKYIITGIWILSGVLSSPRLYFFHAFEYNNKWYCYISRNAYEDFISYDVSFLFLTFALVAPIVTITYTLTIYKLYRHKAPGEQSDHIARRREQQNKRILKMCITIVCLLYLSWSLYFTLFLVWSRGINVFQSTSLYFDKVYLTFFMLFMSFFYNFFIYLFFNNVYRQNIKTIITKHFRCRAAPSDINAVSREAGHEMAQMDEIGEK